MGTDSRLPTPSSTRVPSLQSFGALSNFLRDAIADEDSRALSDSMGELAMQVEAIVAGLRRDHLRTSIAPLLVDLLTVLRSHRTLVLGLGLSWRGLYEYAPYLQALNNFRLLVGRWLQEGGPRSVELQLSAEDFELVAWRTLGEGVLLMDMYEQSGTRERPDRASALGALDEPHVARAVQWWKKLRR